MGLRVQPAVGPRPVEPFRRAADPQTGDLECRGSDSVNKQQTINDTIIYTHQQTIHKLTINSKNVVAYQGSDSVSKQQTINNTTPNLPTNIVDFRGFDSSTILILRGGILRPIGDFPESSSQAMLVGCNVSRGIGRKQTTN